MESTAGTARTPGTAVAGPCRPQAGLATLAVGLNVTPLPHAIEGSAAPRLAAVRACASTALSTGESGSRLASPRRAGPDPAAACSSCPRPTGGSPELVGATMGQFLTALGGAATVGLARAGVRHARLVEALLCCGVTVLDALPVLRVVLPALLAPLHIRSVRLDLIAPVFDVDVVREVVVAVHVDVDVATTPVASAPE